MLNPFACNAAKVSIKQDQPKLINIYAHSVTYTSKFLKIKMENKPSELFPSQPIQIGFSKMAFITKNGLDQMWGFLTDTLLETELGEKYHCLENARPHLSLSQLTVPGKCLQFTPNLRKKPI